jgi:hypothetical protein
MSQKSGRRTKRQGAARQGRDPEEGFWPRCSIVVKCPRCGTFVGSDVGRTRRIRVLFETCARCLSGMNGLPRRSPAELGVL